MEYRNRERKHLFLYLDILDRKTGEIIGQLGDISSGGLMIITTHDIPLHIIKHLRIRLPDDENFDHPHLDIDVETRWAKPDINPELQCIGCQFLEISPRQHTLIVEIEQWLTFTL